tara:strand:+ start:2744 stop:3889 length:1146 start_codon:yes stop_codon:yes gene_type:complete
MNTLSTEIEKLQKLIHVVKDTYSNIKKFFEEEKFTEILENKCKKVLFVNLFNKPKEFLKIYLDYGFKITNFERGYTDKLYLKITCINPADNNKEEIIQLRPFSEKNIEDVLKKLVNSKQFGECNIPVGKNYDIIENKKDNTKLFTEFKEINGELINYLVSIFHISSYYEAGNGDWSNDMFCIIKKKFNTDDNKFSEFLDISINKIQETGINKIKTILNEMKYYLDLECTETISMSGMCIPKLRESKSFDDKDYFNKRECFLTPPRPPKRKRDDTDELVKNGRSRAGSAPTTLIIEITYQSLNRGFKYPFNRPKSSSHLEGKNRKKFFNSESWNNQIYDNPISEDPKETSEWVDSQDTVNYDSDTNYTAEINPNTVSLVTVT